MPDKDVLTAEQFGALEGWTEQHVHRMARRKGWPIEESKTPSANGKPKFLYSVSSLSPQAQMKYASGTLDLASRKTPTTLSLFESAPAAKEKPQRTSIPEELSGQAKQRFDAIRPLLEFRANTNGHRPRIEAPDGRVIDTLDELAAYVGAQQKPPVSRRTMRRWLDRWLLAQKKGRNAYVALAKSQRCDAGGPGSKFFAAHPIAEVYLKKKYSLDGKEGKPSALAAWESLVRDWQAIGERGNPPSYPVCRRYIANLPGPLKTLAREGEEEYVATASLSIVRGKTPVMHTWISDHRTHDVLLRNTLYAEMKPGQAYRMWFTAIYDMGSHCVVGYCFSPNPSWRTIHSAIRMAASEYGFPQEFYWDNGKDFAKAKRMLQEIPVTKEILGFNFRVTSAIPKHPRSKPIEAYFTRLSRRFDPMWGCAYLGNSPKNRPQAAEEAEKAHNRWLEGKAPTSPLPSDAQFLKAAIQWIEEYNAQTRLESLDQRTPNELMNEAWPERKRVKANPRALDVLLWEPELRTVRAGGRVQMDKMWYEPTDLSLCALDGLKGHEVLVLRDPYNLGEAVAVTKERVFIGELRLQEFIAQDCANPITRDQIQAAMRKQRGAKRHWAEQIALLDLLSQHWGWKTEREGLVERFDAATGTDGQALPAAAPGAMRRGQLPRPRVQRLLQPAFVTDAVAEDAGIFADVMKAED